jgi:hypothetical protein
VHTQCLHQWLEVCFDLLEAAPDILAHVVLQGGSLISANGATWQNIGVK